MYRKGYAAMKPLRYKEQMSTIPKISLIEKPNYRKGYYPDLLRTHNHAWYYSQHLYCRNSLYN